MSEGRDGCRLRLLRRLRATQHHRGNSGQRDRKNEKVEPRKSAPPATLDALHDSLSKIVPERN
jgi:hypothetical protein